MRQPTANMEVVKELQQQVLSMQGRRRLSVDQLSNTGLGLIERSFPEGVFPTGAVHEFISYSPTESAATNGFVTALLHKLARQKQSCVWISTRSTIYPPALSLYGIDPSRILFIDVTRTKEALWTVEEALKCSSLATVVGEFSELDFTQSRRLQLAVEESHVTGFIHRNQPRSENTVACLTRWKIKPLVSTTQRNLPGLGLPRWDVSLEKVRNGRPGSWEVEWAKNTFHVTTKHTYSLPSIQKRKTG